MATTIGPYLLCLLLCLPALAAIAGRRWPGWALALTAASWTLAATALQFQPPLHGSGDAGADTMFNDRAFQLREALTWTNTALGFAMAALGSMLLTLWRAQFAPRLLASAVLLAHLGQGVNHAGVLVFTEIGMPHRYLEYQDLYAVYAVLNQILGAAAVVTVIAAATALALGVWCTARRLRDGPME